MFILSSNAIGAGTKDITIYEESFEEHIVEDVLLKDKKYLLSLSLWLLQKMQEGSLS